MVRTRTSSLQWPNIHIGNCCQYIFVDVACSLGIELQIILNSQMESAMTLRRGRFVLDTDFGLYIVVPGIGSAHHDPNRDWAQGWTWSPWSEHNG